MVQAVLFPVNQQEPPRRDEAGQFLPVAPVAQSRNEAAVAVKNIPLGARHGGERTARYRHGNPCVDRRRVGREYAPPGVAGHDDFFRIHLRLFHRPVENALHVPDPFRSRGAPGQQTVDELGSARAVAVAPLGVGHEHFICQPTGGGGNRHEPAPRRLLGDVTLPRQDFLAVLFVPERPRVGVQPNFVVTMGRDKKRGASIPPDRGEVVKWHPDSRLGFDGVQPARNLSVHRPVFALCYRYLKPGQLIANLLEADQLYQRSSCRFLPRRDVHRRVKRMLLFSLLDAFQIGSHRLFVAHERPGPLFICRRQIDECSANRGHKYKSESGRTFHFRKWGHNHLGCSTK